MRSAANVLRDDYRFDVDLIPDAMWRSISAYCDEQRFTPQEIAAIINADYLMEQVLKTLSEAGVDLIESDRRKVRDLLLQGYGCRAALKKLLPDLKEDWLRKLG
jgi:hypothetical protein